MGYRCIQMHIFPPLERTSVRLGFVHIIFVGKRRNTYRGRRSSNGYM